jgi:serine/threonine-protein kinase RsbW
VRTELREHVELKLSLPAESENLARIRHALSDFAASLGLDESVIADLRLAVNEACSNVVRHAYDGEGAMKVEARPDGDHLVVVVHDSGRGLARASEDPGTGLGLRVASAVSKSMEVRQRGTGTEVRLAFSLGEAA